MDSTILKSNAYQNDLIAKPDTSSSHSKMTIALITSRNNPNVSSVTGSVSNTRTGFTKRFSKPSTIATITEVKKLSTVTPGIKRAISITKIAVRSIRRIRFIKVNLSKYISILQI